MKGHHSNECEEPKEDDKSKGGGTNTAAAAESDSDSDLARVVDEIEGGGLVRGRHHDEQGIR